MNTQQALYNDKDIARILSMSPAWVRGQRAKRLHGEAHILDLTPCYIGRCPRYRKDDVDAFVAALGFQS